MSYIQSIGLAHAPFRHAQKDILTFMLDNFSIPENDIDKVKRLYERSEIETRYSALDDFSLDKKDRTFFEPHKGTSVEKRMQTFFKIAPTLAKQAIIDCLKGIPVDQITHLITVSCTGMAAPGLDIQLVELLDLPTTIHRTSVNFMGCYATLHALKMADAFCQAQSNAKVLIVSVELCTLHFHNEYTMDHIASSLLFGDGAAAAFITNDKGPYTIQKFYADISHEHADEMSWKISSSGFLMTLSGFIPNIIAEKISPLLNNALKASSLNRENIQHWAIHPGGKKIIAEVAKALQLTPDDTQVSRGVLKDYGNMSSATILYVLKRMMPQLKNKNENIICAAFGPGLTIETLFLTSS